MWLLCHCMPATGCDSGGSGGGVGFDGGVVGGVSMVATARATAVFCRTAVIKSH